MQVRYHASYTNWRDLVVPYQKEHYELSFLDSTGKDTLLALESSGYTEQILRGLVHSGVTVTIKEVKTLVPDPDNSAKRRPMDEMAGVNPMYHTQRGAMPTPVTDEPKQAPVAYDF